MMFTITYTMQNGDVLVGNRSPRYVKEAYKRLMIVNVRYPKAYLSLVIGNGMPEYSINHFSANNGGMTSFGGAYYNDKAFNEKEYPEVGTGESFAPIWGSGKQAYYDFQDGDYVWGAFNAGMAVSDVFLLKSVFSGLGKAVLSKGIVGGSKRYFGYGMSHEYGASVARWKNLGINTSGYKHHWAISQQMMERYPLLKPIGNQTWNLTRFSSQASHMRWGHGQIFYRKGYRYWRLVYPFSSTPLWFKWNLSNRLVNGSENIIRDD